MTQVQPVFREVMRERAEAFLASDFHGVASYDDRAQSVRPLETYTAILRATPFLSGVELRNGESFLYWAKERAAGKPTVTISHVTLLRDGHSGQPPALVVSRQVFASHYMDGALGVTAVARSADGAHHYLVYLNRTLIDVLGGLLAPLKRAVVEGRISVRRRACSTSSAAASSVVHRTT